VQDADDVLGPLAPQRNPRHRGLQHGLHHLLGGIVGADREHGGAVDHHIRDHQIAQVEQAGEHVAGMLLDAALAVQEIDRAAQFLVRREDRLIVVAVPAEQPQQPPHQGTDAHQHGSQQPHGPVDRTRDQQGDAVGRVEGRGLRQHFGEHHHHDRHHHRGVNHANVAEPGEQHAGRERGGGNVGGIVAEQQRTDHALARVEQAVDDGRVAIAVLF